MNEKIISNILDLPKVDGVCIFDLSGHIVHSRMPEYIVDELFADIGRRIDALFQMADENFVKSNDMLLKYPARSLFIRRASTFYLVVLTEPDVNQVSLRMVTNVAMKHLSLDDFIQIEFIPNRAETTVESKPKAGGRSSHSRVTYRGIRF